MNKEIIINEIERLGFTLGCYDDEIDSLNKTGIQKVLEALSEEYVDVYTGKYVVEIATVDNEKDLSILTKVEYHNRYGRR